MLDLQESSGFEVMREDELYYINGGSGSGFSVSTSGSYTNPLTWSAGVDVTISSKGGTFSAGVTISDTNGTLSATGHISYTSNSSSSTSGGC